MKLKLNKKKLKNLSKDNQVLPNDMTPEVGGGMAYQVPNLSEFCHSQTGCTLQCNSNNEYCSRAGSC